MLKDKIKTELFRRFQESRMQPITITMKADKAVLTITPCNYYGVKVPTSESDIEYYLVDGCEACWAGFETLDELAEFLADYEANVKQHREACDACERRFKDMFDGRPDSIAADPFYAQKLSDFRDQYRSLHGKSPKIVSEDGVLRKIK